MLGPCRNCASDWWSILSLLTSDWKTRTRSSKATTKGSSRRKVRIRTSLVVNGGPSAESTEATLPTTFFFSYTTYQRCQISQFGLI